MGLRYFLSIFVFAGSFASAEKVSCLPEYTSLRATADLSEGAEQIFVLKSENSKGIFESKARMTASLVEDQLVLKFHWDENFSGVSLPYNLYSVLVIQDEVALGWYDFTGDCQGPGIGFFPQQSFKVRAAKVGENKQFKIIVWGRIN